MATFLDLRISQGMATGPLATGNGTFLGSIGLQVDGATAIRVALAATFGVNALTTPALITINILRNIPASVISSIFNPANIIYSNTQLISESGEPTIIVVDPADFNPPTSPTEPGQINYSLWVSSNRTDTLLSGPQTLWGIAAS